jgi:NADH dehydrogenase
VRDSPLRTTVFAPSIIYDRDDPWTTTMRRLTLLPVIPISGEGQAEYQPIWVDDVARCVIADLDRDDGSRRFELAGPQRLSYDQIAREIARSAGRDRPLFHVPLGLVHYGLAGLRRAVGDAAFATWEEAELMEVPMVSERGAEDVRALGVEPRPMAEVLG